MDDSGFGCGDSAARRGCDVHSHLPDRSANGIQFRSPGCGDTLVCGFGTGHRDGTDASGSDVRIPADGFECRL